MYKNARYKTPPTMTQPNAILVDINGVQCSVPLDPANSDYAAIMALVAEGKLVIAPSETP
jgi:hypothetical protein